MRLEGKKTKEILYSCSVAETNQRNFTVLKIVLHNFPQTILKLTQNKQIHLILPEISCCIIQQLY